jgi:V8-like Glu-specific endopeptidase
MLTRILHAAVFYHRCVRGCCLAAAMFLVMAPAARADDFIATIDQIKGSIAPVVCYNMENGKVTTVKAIVGSAFFVDRAGTFLTAGHVISEFFPDHKLSNCAVSAIYVPDDGDKWHAPPQKVRWHKFIPSTCVINQIVDLAQCKPIDDLSSGIFKPQPITIKNGLEPDGTPVGITGFPLNDVFPLSFQANVAGYVFNNMFGARISLDNTAWPGASGSPVYLKNGQVIGMILRRGTGDAQGLSFAASGDALQNFVRAAAAK